MAEVKSKLAVLISEYKKLRATVQGAEQALAAEQARVEQLRATNAQLRERAMEYFNEDADLESALDDARHNRSITAALPAPNFIGKAPSEPVDVERRGRGGSTHAHAAHAAARGGGLNGGGGASYDSMGSVGVDDDDDEAEDAEIEEMRRALEMMDDDYADTCVDEQGEWSDDDSGGNGSFGGDGGVGGDGGQWRSQSQRQMNLQGVHEDDAAAGERTRTVSVPVHAQGGAREREGYLTKRGGLVKTWKRRWFVLANGVLSYYRDDTKGKPLGSIDLSTAARCLPSSELNKPNLFKVETPARTYYIYSHNFDDMQDWVELIRMHTKR